jgi:hypothetical protein
MLASLHHPAGERAAMKRTTVSLALEELDDLVREHGAAGRSAELNMLIREAHKRLLVSRMAALFGTQPVNRVERDEEGERVIVSAE